MANHNSLVKSLKDNLVTWCERNSIFIISKLLLETSRARRFFSILFFTIGIFCCIFVTTLSLRDYLKYKTTVSIHHYQDRETMLPAITICNMNPYKIDKIGEYFSYNPIGDKKYDDCIKTVKKNWHTTCFKGNETMFLNYYIRSFKGLLENDQSVASNRSKYSYNLKDDMMISCLYNLNVCTADNFTQFWSRQFGNCYTFGDGKKNPILKASGTGSFLGLILELVVCKYYKNYLLISFN
jgi:hypothetical protein